MKEKTLKYLCLSVISIYFLFGLFFFGMDKDVNSKGQHLENSKGQEIAFKMNELEKEVMKRIHTIDQLCGGLNADMEKQLKEEIKKLTKEQSVELVKVILA